MTATTATEYTTTAGTRQIGMAPRHRRTVRTVTYTDGTNTLTLMANKSGQPVCRLCDKCGGAGFLFEYAGIHDGVCYSCNGSGFGHGYKSAKHGEQAVKRFFRTARANAIKWAAEAAEAARIAEERRAAFTAWAEANETIVAKIRKGAEDGNRYMSGIVFNCLDHQIIPDTHELAVIDRIIAEMDAKAARTHYGTAGARITISATVTRTASFEVESFRPSYFGKTQYDTVCVITLTDTEGNEFTIKGTSNAAWDLLNRKGEIVTVKGTIEHSEYKGNAQTLLKRPVVMA